MIYRPCQVLFSLLPLLSIARAQDSATYPPEAVQKRTVQQLLASTEPGQQAWGAYLAANYQQVVSISAIIPLLRSHDVFVAAGAIDALIRLRADVPEEDLIAFADANPPSAVIVLAAREPKKHSALLIHLLDRAAFSDWVAVDRLLLAFSPPGYAAWLWKGWRPRFEVRVGELPDVIGDLFCSRYGGTEVERRAGFPPTYEYLIDGQFMPGDTLLVQGAPPLGYLRKERGPRLKPCPVDYQGRRTEDLRLLAGAMRTNDALIVPRLTTFPWVDSAQYRADAEGLRKRIRSMVEAIRNGLITRGRLTGSEASVLPEIDVKEIDLRPDRTIALPAIGWRLGR